MSEKEKVRGKMASSWGDVMSEQADLISTRLRQLVSSGLHFLHEELGIDLGLKPELYPAWVILSTALIGLVLLLVLVAACGGARRRKQGAARSKSTAAVSATESVKAAPVKAPKPDEPKKKNKKKTAEKVCTIFLNISCIVFKRCCLNTPLIPS